MSQSIRFVRVVAVYPAILEGEDAMSWIARKCEAAVQNHLIRGFWPLTVDQMGSTQNITFKFSCTIDTGGTIDGAFARAKLIADTIVGDSDTTIENIELS
jgi:hypothetical protein